MCTDSVMARLKSRVPSLLATCELACVSMMLLALVIGERAFAVGGEASMAEGDPSPTQLSPAGPDVALGLNTNPPSRSVPALRIAPDPEFPKSVKLPAGTNVFCIVGLVVDRNGMPEKVHVVRSAGRAFDANAMKAVRQYRFKPALRHGHPIAAAVNVVVRFGNFPKVAAVRPTN